MSAETDWEQCYLLGDTPWDKGVPSPGLIDFLDRNPLTGKVVVPGCGYAHDVAEIARRADNVGVTGLDISRQAVTAANEKLEEIGNASVVQGDMFEVLATEHRGVYDWVWEHTCFCAIDPSRREDYVSAVADMLKPSGALLAVFYLNPQEREDSQDGPPFGCTTGELDALFSPRFVLSKSWVPTMTYPGREGRELMRLYQKRNYC